MMNRSNSIKAIDRTDLSEQTKFWLDEISQLSSLRNYFNEEIRQRKLCSKKLSKYVAVFDYTDKILIVLSAVTGGVYIFLFTSIVGALVGIASASFTLLFSLTTGIKKFFWVQQEKKKKKSIIKLLCWLKVNSVALKL